jgi:hypothetical protein
MKKRIMGSVCLASFCAVAVWLEFGMMLYFGTALTLFTVAFALAALSTALYGAPEGYERADGFYIRPRDRRSGLVRHVQLSQPARARE